MNYVLDGQDVIEDRSTGGTPLMRYLNGLGIDEKLRQDNQSTGASYSYQADQVGSTGLLTNVNGNIAEEINYSAFGVTAGSPLTLLISVPLFFAFLGLVLGKEFFRALFGWY